MSLGTMANRFKRGNYIQLGIQSTFLFLAIQYVVIVLHEIGHGLGGILAGLRFNGLYVAVFGGGTVYVSGSRAGWQRMFERTSGPVVDLVLGLVVLFVILPRAKKWGFRLFWLFVALTALFGFWEYMAISSIIGYGEYLAISRILKVNLFWIGIIGLLGLIIFTFPLSRQISRTFSPYFPLNSYGKKFAVMFIVVSLPRIFHAIGYHFFSYYRLLSELLLMSSFAIITSILLSFYRHKSGLSSAILPRWPSIAGITAFCLAVAVWLGVFGSTAAKPKGLLWRAPEEDRVTACNVNISIQNNLKAKVDFLMRSYPAPLFWAKLKSKTPSWSVYEKFIENHTPELTGNTDYKIIEKVNEVSSDFYFHGAYSKGGRRISLLANLDKKVDMANKNTLALELTDFWRARGGFLDKISINLEEGVKFSGYELIPKDSRNPDVYDEQKIIWENMDSSGPEKIRLIISTEYIQREDLGIRIYNSFK